MKPTFSIVNLPKLQPEEYSVDNPIAKKLAERFKDLRLLALKQSPEAYASSYEVEVQRHLEHTMGRLKMSNADHFIALDRLVAPWTPDKGSEFFEALFDANWIGVMVNVGPIGSSNTIVAKNDSLAPDGSTDLDDMWKSAPAMLDYSLNGTFVAPAYRCHGIAQALIQAIFDKVQAEAGERGAGIQFTVLVDSKNGPARKLYEKMEFSETERETYVQIPRELAGELESKEMVAVRMELVKASVPEYA